MRRITVSQYGEATYEMKKSVFIGYCKPVLSQEEAIEFVESIKHKNSDARHNVYAWILKKDINLQKYSDDGEPSGTAGLPILSVLSKNEISDAVVVVTRYFGGILLGKGGLIRAYTRAASEAVKAAMPVVMEMCYVYELAVDYKNSDKLLYDIRSRKYNIQDIDYGAEVTIRCIIPLDEIQEFCDYIVDISNGRIIPEKIDEIEAGSESVHINYDIDDEEA